LYNKQTTTTTLFPKRSLTDILYVCLRLRDEFHSQLDGRSTSTADHSLHIVV